MVDVTPIEIVRCLSPLSRTLVHRDNEHALEMMAEWLPGMQMQRYPSGQPVWTWRIPNSWRATHSQVLDADSGEVLWDGMSHPLATVNYSQPVDMEIDAAELEPHLFVSKARPEAIPFVFRFYNRDWGFCMPVAVRDEIISRSRLHVTIEVEEVPGELLVGEYLIAGENAEEIMVVSDICHPSIANDSITGVAAAIDLARHLQGLGKPKYSYRFLFLPETIGSIAYLANNEDVIANTVAGFFSEMLGNDNSLCLQHSRPGDHYIDMVALSSLQDSGLEYRSTEFLMCAANDEKVMDAPGVNIPTISLSRAPYPEYHTSDDNADFIDVDVLNESCAFIRQLFDRIESDYVPRYTTRGPVCLAEHGLYPDWYRDPSLKDAWEGYLKVQYALDDERSCEQLAAELGIPVSIVRYWTDSFAERGFVEPVPYVLKS